MRCRSCHKEISDESSLCFFCGAAQEPYIARRQPHNRKRKPTSRGTLITAISLILVVVVILAAGPLIRNAQKLPRFEEIKTDIATLDTEDELAVTAVKSKIENFNRDYPDTPELLEIKGLMEGTMGWIIDDTPPSPIISPGSAADNAAEAVRQALRETVSDEVLSVDALDWEEVAATGKTDVSVRWRNKSTRDIRDIYFTVEARDADGKLVPGALNPEKDRVVLHPSGPFAPTGTNDPYSSVWYDVWPGGVVREVILFRVDIYYKDNRRLTLDKELIDLVMK